MKKTIISVIALAIVLFAANNNIKVQVNAVSAHACADSDGCR